MQGTAIAMPPRRLLRPVTVLFSSGPPKVATDAGAPADHGSLGLNCREPEHEGKPRIDALHDVFAGSDAVAHRLDVNNTFRSRLMVFGTFPCALALVLEARDPARNEILELGNELLGNMHDPVHVIAFPSVDIGRLDVDAELL